MPCPIGNERGESQLLFEEFQLPTQGALGGSYSGCGGGDVHFVVHHSGPGILPQ
jgi:hypothetical protein